MASIACPFCEYVVNVHALKSDSVVRFYCSRCGTFECAAKDYQAIYAFSAKRKQHCTLSIQALPDSSQLLRLSRSNHGTPPRWKLRPVENTALPEHEIPHFLLEVMGIVRSRQVSLPSNPPSPTGKVIAQPQEPSLTPVLT